MTEEGAYLIDDKNINWEGFSTQKLWCSMSKCVGVNLLEKKEAN